jgi:ectoine hydroxylase
MSKYSTRKNIYGSVTSRVSPVIWSDLKSDFLNNYKVNGYLLLKNKIKKNHIVELKELCNTLYIESRNEDVPDKTKGIKRSTLDIHTNNAVKNALRNSGVGAVIKDILGSDFYTHQSRVNFKAPNSSGWTWHSDFETWHSQDGMPDMRCLSVMIPITENSIYNGPLEVIPGSHHYYYSAPRNDSTYCPQEYFVNQRDGVPKAKDVDLIKKLSKSNPVKITCTPGDIFIFDCNTMHRSSRNNSSTWRTNLFIVCNSIYNKLHAPYSYSLERPEHMAHRRTYESF